MDSVVAALGLTKVRGTLVGGAMRRGVSGGERKRVSVAHELLIDPSVLILDEPTSGLDSTTAMNLIFALRGLAQGGRTLITTIHQPSSRLYQQLDELILMSDGHVMYSGRGSEAARWFGYLGCQLPYGVNVADFVLDLASGAFEHDQPVLGATGGDRQKRLIEVRTKWLVLRMRVHNSRRCYLCAMLWRLCRVSQQQQAAIFRPMPTTPPHQAGTSAALTAGMPHTNVVARSLRQATRSRSVHTACRSRTTFSRRAGTASKARTTCTTSSTSMLTP